MRVLVTGARAPVTLDLVRRLRAAGHDVFAADSVRFGAARFSRSVHRFIPLPRASKDYDKYGDSLGKAIDDFRIELMIPTCEEILHVSRLQHLLNCPVLCDTHEKLLKLHGKWTFAESGSNEFAQVPETILLRSADDLQRLTADSTDWVFKPEFSRFAAQTLIGPSAHQLRAAKPQPGSAWIAQRRIRGQEYSTYSIARDGKLRAHACYLSRYRAGRGAGIYFVPTDHRQIEGYIRELVRREHFTGQIGCDLIESAEHGGLFVIEANPRATSGLHVFAESDPIVDLMIGGRDDDSDGDCLRPSGTRPLMVECAMPIWGLMDAFRRGLLPGFPGDCLRARCVSWRWSDPLPSFTMPLSVAEFAWIAMRRKINLLEATTWDIEWNGEPQ